MSANAIQHGGQIVVISIMSIIASDGNGMVASDFNAYDYITNNPSMSFFSVIHNYYETQRQLWINDFRDIAAAVRDGRLNPVIAKLFKLSDAVLAHEKLVSGQQVMGKMMFLVDDKLATSYGL